MLSAFTLYANYPFTANNGEKSKIEIFSKIWSKIIFFSNDNFFCIGHQSLSLDMQNIIPPPNTQK